MPTPHFSVVLPAYNEEDTVDELYRRLTQVFHEQLPLTYELIFVDDGSTDGTFLRLRRLHEEDARVRVLRFARNFGYHSAITAGLDAARGEIVALMDADLQDTPEALPTLYRRLEEGFDVVHAIRVGANHPPMRRALSRLLSRFMRRLGTEQELDGTIFRIARRPVVDAVKQCREQARFVLGLFSWVGFRQTGVEIPHAPRFAGVSKYSISKTLRLLAHSVTAFSRLPLQFAIYAGGAVSTLAFAFAVWVVLLELVWDTAVTGWSSTIVILLFLGGVQLLCLGVLGDYVGRIFAETQNRPLYVVSAHLDKGKRHE